MRSTPSSGVSLLSLSLCSVFLSAVNGEWDGTNIRSILLPSHFPESRDPYQCIQLDLTQYFKPPLPTGALYSALDAHGATEQEACISTYPGWDVMFACFPSDEQFCSFPTASPEYFASYSAFASTAASWWREHSRAAVSDARDCPWQWRFNLWEVKGGAFSLNSTISHARCWEKLSEEAITTADAAPSASATTTDTSNAATPGGSGEEDHGATATPGPENAGVNFRRDGGYGTAWAAAANAGVAVAMANAAF